MESRLNNGHPRLLISFLHATNKHWDAFHAVLEGEPLDPRGVGYRLLSECELSSQLTTSTSGGQQAELLAT